MCTIITKYDIVGFLCYKQLEEIWLTVRSNLKLTAFISPMISVSKTITQ